MPFGDRGFWEVIAFLWFSAAVLWLLRLAGAVAAAAWRRLRGR